MSIDMSVFNRFAVNFSPDEIIFCEYEPGDAFYLIQEGRVKIVKIMGEIEKTIDILKPGEFFGEMALLEEAPRSATAIALDNTKMLEFNRANFEVLMQGNPQMVLNLLKLFSCRIYDQKRRFMILTLPDDQAKVADVFLMLSEAQGQSDKEDSNDNSREFKNSVDDIAHWAGMSPARCREILNHFSSQRRVDIMHDHIVVRNINDFARFVASRRSNQILDN